MTPKDFYQKRIKEYREKGDNFGKQETRLSIARLITFLSGIILFIILLPVSLSVAVIVAALCFSLFGWLVVYHSKTEHSKLICRYLETINNRELNCINGIFNEFPDGSEYINSNHKNSYDLDLFGHSSVFQFLNRTSSRPAADTLAGWLKEPASIEEINLRQQAFLELKDQTDWRQKLNSLAYSNTHGTNDPDVLVKWVQDKDENGSHRFLKSITYSLSAFAIVSTILVVLLRLPFSLLVIIYSINFIYYFSQAKKISKIHNQVSKSAEMLKAYSSTIRLIEDNNFECTKLKELHNIFTQNIKVSDEIGLLSKLVNRLDARLNIMVSVPLNLYFFWDIRQCIALENWRKRHCNDISKWFSAMSEFEVLSCFANVAFNNPQWTTPVIVTEYFKLEVKNTGHPLIPSERRIANSFNISGSGKTVIITGSNMSGKSTFLRTIGVNTILALAGAPVCADLFKISHVQVLSSMRISDSLEDNTSSFYAELKKLAYIIKTAENNPRLLLLLDEILRGTNSNDRFSGSVALLKQLTGYGTANIVATHDLKLAELEKEIPGKIDNYHFDVKVDGDELYFDYKLNPGICKSMNASILMKKMGIRLE